MDIIEFQSIFEYELKRKLAQRSRSPQEELRKVISAFKFFDYTSTFILEKNQWIKGVLRTGLCGFNVNDLAKVFERYDPNKTGYINYLNFCNYLYGKEKYTPLSPDFENNFQGNENNIVNNKKNINEFKPPGLYERNFEEIPNENQLSHYNNTESSLNKYNININNNNRNNISTNPNFTNNNNMNIPKEEIKINENNSNIVANKNLSFNTPNIEDNRNVNKPRNYHHMAKSQSQIIISNKDKMNNNIIENNNNFQINNIKNENNNNISSNNNNINEESKNYFTKLVNIFKNKINTNNGITYYTFAHALKTLEDKNTKTVNIESLLSIIEQMNLNINQDDLINFYSILDYTQSNKVLTDEILRILRGEIPEKRKILVITKFAELDKEKAGIIPISIVKNLYNAKFHPDAFLGKKSEENVYKEFLYTFGIFCEINDLKEEISYKEFVDYYTPISSSILNDNYFDDILYGVWNIESYNNNIKIDKVNDINITNDNNNNNINLDSKMNNKIIEDDFSLLDNGNQRNNINNNLSKSMAFDKEVNNRIFSPNKQVQNVKKQRMTPYYNPRASPEGKGIKMFRQLRYNPLTSEYILSPVPPEPKENLMNNNMNENFNMNNNNNEINNNMKTRTSGFEKLYILRDLLGKRGQKSIFIIQRMLYIYDQNQTGEIPFDKLCDIFEIYNINLKKEDIFDIFNILDKEHKGIIRYNDLIHILISDINEKRELIIQNLFERLSKGKGFVTIDELKQSFDPMKHPDVINKIRDHEEVYVDFLDTLQIFKEYNGNLQNENVKKGIITFEDFSNFLKGITMSFDDDIFFEYYINNCWTSGNDNTLNNNTNNRYGYDNNNDNVRIRAGKQIMDGL